VLVTPRPALTKAKGKFAMADPRLCAVTGCINSKHTKYFCSTHAWRFKHHGNTAKPVRRKPQLSHECSVEGCEAAPDRGRKGMCARLYRRGTTEPKIAMRGEPEAWLRAHVGHDDNRCLIWPFARSGDGVGRLGSKIEVGTIHSAQAPRAMCALAHGEPPFPHWQAAHKCGKGHHGCVNPQHLEWKSPLGNTRDKERHGTMLRGERHPHARLTALHVRAIRALASQFSVPDLVDLFGASPRTIAEIISGKGWQCLA
jgi:hypothetical protein